MSNVPLGYVRLERDGSLIPIWTSSVMDENDMYDNENTEEWDEYYDQT